MENLGLYVAYTLTTFGATKYLKNDDMINIRQTLTQSGVIAVGIVIFTLIINMIKAYRSCEAKKDQSKSLGLKSGFTLSIFATIFAVGIFYWFNASNFMIRLITKILPFLSNYWEFCVAVVVGLAGFIGYWFGRIFISIC